eukprot:TRINITY_DN10030_c0_g1_i1.p1 TRINITY_DN10030_c0_g1~~TRINITY_DN10030_c0_g1_i1.p1  ORF type:complete len:329 (-),score=94.69 TRINITY_DN10030_c0_g1_i1:337-1323(-)
MASEDERSDIEESEQESSDMELQRPKKKAEPTFAKKFALPLALTVVGMVFLIVGIVGLNLPSEAFFQEEVQHHEPVIVVVDENARALVEANPIIGNYTMPGKPNCWRFIDGSGHITGIDGQNPTATKCGETSESLFGLFGAAPAPEGDENAEVTDHDDLLHGTFMENNTKIVVDFSKKGGPAQMIGTLEQGHVASLTWPNKEMWSQRSPYQGLNVTGKCNLQDYVNMWVLGSGNEKGTFPQRLSVCGKNSYRPWTGFNVEQNGECIQHSTGLSKNCTSCFDEVALYGIENCKRKCWRGWCTKSCLSCSTAFEPLAACVGIPWPMASVC